IFIVGMPRSGSTLVEQILASHPRVYAAGELGDVPQFFKQLTEANADATPLIRDPDMARSIAGDFAQRLATLSNGRRRVTIKNLQHTLHVGLAAAPFLRTLLAHSL